MVLMRSSSMSDGRVGLIAAAVIAARFCARAIDACSSRNCLRRLEPLLLIALSLSSGLNFARCSRMCFVHINPKMTTKTMPMRINGIGMPPPDEAGASAGVEDNVGRRTWRGCQRAKTIPHAEHSSRPASCAAPHFGHSMTLSDLELRLVIIIIRYGPVSKFLIAVTVASALLFACAKKDPFDQALIQKDLQKRTAQEVHDAADKFSYDPPADRLLTEKQIADYVRVTKLADEIRNIADRNANEHVDRASAAATGAARFGESMAVFGSVRAYATAELRASLDLGLNPKEHEWVGQRVVTALDTINSIVRREDQISAKKAEMDAEIDP